MVHSSSPHFKNVREYWRATITWSNVAFTSDVLRIFLISCSVGLGLQSKFNADQTFKKKSRL